MAKVVTAQVSNLFQICVVVRSYEKEMVCVQLCRRQYVVLLLRLAFCFQLEHQVLLTIVLRLLRLLLLMLLLLFVRM